MFLLPLLILTFARVSSGESLFTDETLHERVATQTPWSFAGATGPLAWAGMEPQTWAACSTSKLQSPIDLDSSYKVYGSKPEFSVPVTSPMPCLYNGHTFKVNMTDAHVLTKYGGQDYSLNQFHFHTPSEHFIDGDYFPLEMHFVHHRVSDNSLLVIAVFFSLTKGRSHPFLTNVIKNIDRVSKDQKSTTGRLYLTLLNLRFAISDFYEYNGSLTIPPCTDTVTWVVAKSPLDIDLDDWYKLKRLMKFNSRFIQNAPGQTNLIEMAASSLAKSD